MARICVVPECDAPIMARPGEYPYQTRKRRCCSPEHANIARVRNLPHDRKPGMRPSEPDIVAVLTGQSPEWMAQGVCRGQVSAVHDPWHAERGARDKFDQIEHAKDVCRGCPVVADCLDYALRGRIFTGVWGATTPRERRRMLRTVAA